MLSAPKLEILDPLLGLFYNSMGVNVEKDMERQTSPVGILDVIEIIINRIYLKQTF